MADSGTKIPWIERARKLGCAVVIPTYNNDRTLAEVIAGVGRYCADIFVVNDGSTDRTAEVLASTRDIRVIAYARNRGKGYALRTGLRAAREAGFRYAVTIDSDGQHYPDDIARFIERIEEHPDTLLIGARNLTADNMPSKNTFANRFSNFWYLSRRDTASTTRSRASASTPCGGWDGCARSAAATNSRSRSSSAPHGVVSRSKISP